MIDPLPHTKAEELLEELNDWEFDEAERAISKEFEFDNFSEAMEFANRVGEIAEEHQHHPDMHVSWGKVVVKTTTHDAGGLTKKDFALASDIDALPL